MRHVHRFLWIFIKKQEKKCLSRRKGALLRRAAGLLLLAILFCLGGCAEQRTADHYLAYRRGSFSAELTGNRRGRDFSCTAEVINGEIRSVTYHSPEALRDVLLQREDEVWRAHFGETEFRFEQTDSAEELLSPIRLLLAEGGEVASAQRLAEGVQISLSCPAFPDPIVLTLTEDGAPSVISSGEWTLRVSINPS